MTKMTKYTKKYRRQTIIKAGIALSLGIVVPLLPLQTAWAATGNSAVMHTGIINGSNFFKDYQDESSSTFLNENTRGSNTYVYNYLKMSTGNLHVDGYGPIKTTSPPLSKGNWSYYAPLGRLANDENRNSVNIFYSGQAIKDGYNALMIKYYDPDSNKECVRLLSGYTGSNSYDVANVIGTSKLKDGLEFVNTLDQLVNEILANPNVVDALQGASDDAGRNAILETYLPSYYLTKLTSEEMEKFYKVDGEGNVVVNQPTQSVDDFLSKFNDLSQTVEFGSGITFSKGEVSDNSTKIYGKVYAEEKKSVDAGDTWEVEGRAVTYKSDATIMDDKVSEGTFELDKNKVVFYKGKVYTYDDIKTNHPELTYLLADTISTATNNNTDQSNHSSPCDENNITNSVVDVINKHENIDVAGTTEGVGNVQTVVAVKNLETGVGSVIDMSAINTRGEENALVYQDSANNGRVQADYVDSDGNTKQTEVAINRTLVADEATLGNDTTFRLGVYTHGSNSQQRLNDSVFIQTAKNTEQTNLNIQLGWVPEIKEGSAIGSWTRSESLGPYNVLLGILENADKFQITGQETEIDGISAKYLVIPDIVQKNDYFTVDGSAYKTDASGNYLVKQSGEEVVLQKDGVAFAPTGENGSLSEDDIAFLQANNALKVQEQQGTAWYLNGYAYADTGELSESGKSVSENSTVTNNFIKAANMSMFRRSEGLHGERLNRHEAGGKGPGSDISGLEGELRENMWAEMWHGKFDAAAGYARNTNQTYNGFQIGYDKLLHKKFYGGKVYTGFYASKLDGKSNTATGKGEQDAYGVGVYSSWIGDKGHFIDLGVNATKIKNDFHFTGNTGIDMQQGKVKGENSTWAYGIGAQYGKRNELAANWFWEPSVSLYVGHVDESNYSLSNGLGVNEKGYDTAIGKLSLKAGKNIGTQGNVYAGVSWGHEFAAGQKLHQTYGALDRLVETVGGNDSWWEWNVGGKVKLSPNASFNLDFVKTTGSDVGNEWSINGGLDFSWGGFGSGAKAAKANGGAGLAINGDGITGPSFAKAQSPTVVVGQAPQVANVQVPQMQQPAQGTANADNNAGGTVAGAAVYDMGEVTSNVVADNTASVSGTVADGMGEFELGGLTVEAKRPDWEKNLSPGQVSVIYPNQFEGEQKNLPELLDRVPGLFVQRVNGAGHYTVARVRGSTAAQVSVYVDGVQMNLTGDAAVNLSAIPADNIERIEVYRGYVPARFAGAPLGGVINIITKRPSEGHGHITQGVKSYGGYSSTKEYSMPLGSGSLMATYARDIWQGDFDFTYPGYIYSPIDNINENRTFKRRSNGYQNNNAMLKWQDDNWVVKGVWKKQHEELAKAITKRDDISYLDTGYLDGALDIDYKEFLVGRRDTLGNLDLGWHIAYLDSKKTYNNVGGYRLIADSEAAKRGGAPLPSGVDSKDADEYLPGELWGTYHSKKWNGNLNMALKAGGNHLLEFNGDFTRETMATNGNRWDLTQEQLDTQTGVNRTVRKMLSKYNNREYHLTLQDTITLNDDGDFKLTPVLRADKVEMEGIGNLGDADSRWMYSGGIALQKQLNDQWSIKSTWGTYNRHPNFYEIFGDGGFIGQNYVFTVDSKGGNIDNGLWETGSQFDFSVNWQGRLANADASTILTWYQRKANNQLVLWTPRGGGGLSCYCPTGNTETYGIELAHNMKWRRLNLGLAATWQKSKEVGDGLGYNYNWASSGSSFVPEWVVSARLDYLFPGDKLNVFGEYRFNDHEVLRGTNNDKGVDVKDSYSIVDLGVKYKFDKNWRLSAGVNDVFDKGRDVFVSTDFANYGPLTPNYYPLAGRMYYTTLEYSF